MTEAILTAATIVFLVLIIRAIPWPDGWKRRKPLACHACMVGWIVILFVLIHLIDHGAAGGWRELLALLPAAGLAALALTWQGATAGPDAPPP